MALLKAQDMPFRSELSPVTRSQLRLVLARHRFCLACSVGKEVRLSEMYVCSLFIFLNEVFYKMALREFLSPFTVNRELIYFYRSC